MTESKKKPFVGKGHGSILFKECTKGLKMHFSPLEDQRRETSAVLFFFVLVFNTNTKSQPLSPRKTAMEES